MHTDVEYALPRSQPEHGGIASAAILQLIEGLESQMHELHSFMLLRHGHVVAEGWWSPYRPEYQHLMFSVSKSFTSTAVGIAVAEGRLSIDEPILSFFPDDLPSQDNDFLTNMTVRHLLTMTTGHVVDTNELSIEFIEFAFTQSECVVAFKTPTGEEMLRCGYGKWRQGQTNLFNLLSEPWLSDYHALIFTSGGWANEDVFTMVVRLIETPFYYSLAYHFIEDEMLVEIRISVDIELPKTLLLTARLSSGEIQESKRK
jgi:hypothetical protein